MCDLSLKKRNAEITDCGTVSTHPALLPSTENFCPLEEFITDLRIYYIKNSTQSATLQTSN